MKVLVLSGAIPETFKFLISRRSNTNFLVGGETPTFQRNFYCDATNVSCEKLS